MSIVQSHSTNKEEEGNRQSNFNIAFLLMTNQNYLRIDDTILPLVHTILLAITALT